MHKAVTIPKKLTSRGNLVVIPREDYEEYLALKKIVPIINATAGEKQAIREGKKQIKSGKYVTLAELHNVVER